MVGRRSFIKLGVAAAVAMAIATGPLSALAYSSRADGSTKPKRTKITAAQRKEAADKLASKK